MSRLWLRVDLRPAVCPDDATAPAFLGGERGVLRLLVERAALGGAIVGVFVSTRFLKLKS
jgi:hypothetical protein